MLLLLLRRLRRRVCGAGGGVGGEHHLHLALLGRFELLERFRVKLLVRGRVHGCHVSNGVEEDGHQAQAGDAVKKVKVLSGRGGGVIVAQADG